MADSQAAEKLYTLTEVAKKTKISMPTLQRYKKLYQDRIPSVGKGRSQRYREEALDVFRQLKKENIKRRGRPRKNAAAAKPAKRAAKAAPKAAKASSSSASSEELLTLTQIGQMTGISYPTLLRYSKNNLSKIPHKGTGRARRYYPQAVEVFKDLRSKSKRGRKAGTTSAKAVAAKGSVRRGRPPKSADSADLLARVKELEKTNKALVRNLAKIEKKLGNIRIVMR